MNIKCGHCGKDCDASDIFVCSDCGSFLCADCAKNSGALCPGCYGRLNRLC